MMYTVTIITKKGIFYETINDFTEIEEILNKYPEYVSFKAERNDVKVKRKINRN